MGGPTYLLPFGIDDGRGVEDFAQAEDRPASTGTNVANLGGALAAIFTPLQAFSFLTFTLLYTPCVAAIAAVRREMRSGRAAVCVALMQCAIAWVCALAVYQVGSLFIG